MANDKSGRPLSVGDFIVYGHALGRSAALQYGRILKIETKEKYGQQTLSIRVQGASTDDHYDAKRGWVSEAYLLRPGNLQYGDRTLKIEPHQMPNDVFELLSRDWHLWADTKSGERS